MKSQNLKVGKGIAVTMVTLALFFGVGCAKKSDGFDSSTAETPATPTDSTPVAPTTPRDSDGPRGSDFAAGATAALDNVTIARLTEYVATHPVNDPKDLRISVKLQEVEYNQYAGDVYISYYDNGQYYTGHFTADDERNPSSGTKYPNYHHAFYNNWFTYGGKPVFHGFYSDSYGAVMLVIDNVIDQGDGAGSAELSGSIWFKNYPNNQALPNPQSIPCWYITSGPYDCRTFLQAGNDGDGNLNPISALIPTQSQWYTPTSSHPYQPAEPARGWRKLGTFTGLNKTKAFLPMETEATE